MKIVVVEDDEDILALVVRHLQAAGHDVLAMSSAKNALESLVSHEAEVLITDVLMPGVDGIELIFAVRQRLPYTTAAKLLGISPAEVSRRMQQATQEMQKVLAGPNGQVSAKRKQQLDQIVLNVLKKDN